MTFKIMTKLARYLKPYLGLAVLCIGLLLVQACCDLTLPNYMSDIVNVGIQKGGIESASPVALSENGLTLMTTFMTKEDASFVHSAYTRIERGSAAYAALEADGYTALGESVYVPKAAPDAAFASRLDHAFGRA
ncbi:MAG: ABC transporter ATP-binding protein, partial [Pygmaiobacter sp.]